MTFADIAKVVADDFKQTMREEGFETFKDMADCYWWTSADIRDEVGAILDSFGKESGVNTYMSEDGDYDVYLNGDYVTYRVFARMFRKELHN